MRRTAAASIAGAVIAALLAAPSGYGVESASRIVDRTFLCRTVGVGYPDAVRFMNVSAEPFQHLGGAPTAPWLSISNSGDGGAGIGASIRTGPWGSDATGHVSLSRARCAPSSLRLPLSDRSLRGGQTEPFGDNYRCNLPSTILIRIRAEFTRPTVLRPDPRAPSVALVAKGQISTGSLVVATHARRPIVFASAHDASGKTRLFVAPSRCREEP